jgi:opacity protein-like surface antigen
MAARIRLCVALLGAVLSAQAALAQDQQPELTPAGKAILKELLAADGRPPAGFPRAICLFRGGLCGAIRADGTVAVPPRYDWVGRFSEGRAAVRLGGLYGFVDEDGREIVAPKYRIADDYGFGFAQVDVDGKSGLIDRDGRMVIPRSTARSRRWPQIAFVCRTRGGWAEGTVQKNFPAHGGALRLIGEQQG